MEDLQNATVEDVRLSIIGSTHQNVTLVIAGDINKDEVKAMVENISVRFGGDPVEKEILCRALNGKLYHEDNLQRPQVDNGFSGCRTILKGFICP
jgi:predicted Zn-dependent peptidase